MDESEVKIECKGGGSHTDIAPAFTADGSTLFVCSKNAIFSYNTKTGKRMFSYNGFVNDVVGLSVHYLDHCECITACSKSGEIKTWKVETGFKFFEKQIFKKQTEIQYFYLLPSKESGGKRQAIISCLKSQLPTFGVLDLLTGKYNAMKVSLGKGKCKIDVGGNDCFSVVQGNTLYYINFKESRVWRHFINRKLRFTCVASHPTEECVLTGDSLGRVVVWHNLTTKSASQAVHHWHTLPVKCVAFSMFGSFFYSGGEECVLVKWQMDNTLHKNFLPRLPSTIEYIAVSENNLNVAVATGDNGIRIYDSRLELQSVIQYLILSPSSQINMVYDSRTKSLVMNGTVGHLQFYSPYDMNLLYSLDVVGRNKITKERNCDIENIDVTKIAVSKTGLWMATIEQRKNVDAVVEIRLKFWKFDVTKQLFSLNTSVEYPHEDNVSHIEFQPSDNDVELRCVTVGDDKKFKVWELEEISEVHYKGEIWKCCSAASYKDLSANSLSFSVDGTLMAVGFGHTVTTWLPESCELKCSLLHATQREPLKHIHFGTGSCCHFLVSATEHSLNVWNLLTLSMTWTVPLKVSLLVADVLTPNMALFTQDGKRMVFIFTPDSSDPVYTRESIGKEDESVIAATFVPSLFVNDTNLKWCQRSQLYYFTSNRELYCLSTNTNDEKEPAPLVAELDTNNSLYSLMQPILTSSGITPQQPAQHLYTNKYDKNIFAKFLDAPVHTMPPIRLTCGAILQSMVLEKPVNVKC